MMHSTSKLAALLSEHEFSSPGFISMRPSLASLPSYPDINCMQKYFLLNSIYECNNAQQFEFKECSNAIRCYGNVYNFQYCCMHLYLRKTVQATITVVARSPNSNLLAISFRPLMRPKLSPTRTGKVLISRLALNTCRRRGNEE